MTIEELKLNIKWWESKRWIYNLVVGFFGVFAMYVGLSEEMSFFTKTDIFGIIWWGIKANILYSSGMLLELLDWYYLKNRIGIKKIRGLFFTIGLIISSLLTFWCS